MTVVNWNPVGGVPLPPTWGEPGPPGPPGPPGEGVPPDGTTGQVLTKVTDADYDTVWADPTGGGGPGTEEVWIATEEPAPRDALVLWVDTDQPSGGGGGDLTYVHTQSAPSATWTVDHQLDKFPSVDVVDSGGSTIIPDVHYDSLSQVTLLFGSATSGKAYMN